MKLFDRNEKYMYDFEPLSAINKEVLNGEDVLNVTVDFEMVAEKGYRIVCKDRLGSWKEFIVQQIEENRTNGTRAIYAESSFYETFGDYIEDKYSTDVAANIALEKVLLSTRWELGTVDDLGLNTASYYHISAKEAVQKVAETWQGELRTRITLSGKAITHRYVDLLSSRGDFLGERFVTGENINNITRTINSNTVTTALFGYGKGEAVGDGFGRRIDFADINDGKAYVENLDALAIWGRNNPDGSKSHVFSKVEFDDVEDKAILLELTQAKLDEISEPNITYEGDVIDASAKLGDTIILIDETFEPELRLTARVYEIQNDLIENEKSSPVLGNYIPNIADTWNKQTQYINNFRDKEAVWDRANNFGTDGTLDASYVSNLLDEFNTQANSIGGYVYHEIGNGILTIDQPDVESSTMAVQIKGGLIRVSNSKNVDGDWEWTTAINGSGIIAESIKTGTLQGGNVKMDLENGTFLIGESVEDYKLLYDGSSFNIRMSAGGTLEDALSDKVDGETVENLESATADKFAEIESYITFDDGKLIFGQSDSNIKLILDNDILYFKQNDVTVAYLSNNTLFVTDGDFTNSMKIGDFGWLPRTNGNLSFNKLGGE